MKVSEAALVAFACVLASVSAVENILQDNAEKLHAALDLVCLEQISPDDNAMALFKQNSKNYLTELEGMLDGETILYPEDLRDAKSIQTKAEGCANQDVLQGKTMKKLMTRLDPCLERLPVAIVSSHIQNLDVSQLEHRGNRDVYNYLKNVNNNLPKPKESIAVWLKQAIKEGIVTPEEPDGLAKEMHAVHDKVTEFTQEIEGLQSEVADYDKKWKNRARSLGVWTGTRLYNQVISKLEGLKAHLTEIGDVLEATDAEDNQSEEETFETGEETGLESVSSVTPPANEGTDSTTGGPGVAEIGVEETKQNEENLVKTEIVVVEPTGSTGENPQEKEIVVTTTDPKTPGDTPNEEKTVEGILDPDAPTNVTSQQTSVESGEQPSFFKRHRGKIVVTGIVVILLAGALVGAYMVLGH